MLRIHADGNPTVSVVLATYNRAGFLRRSIDSFLAQDFCDAELIVVDDGSEDDTYTVVGNYMRQDKRIRYQRHSNRKLSLSRNAGIAAATGRYVAFLDSDDAYLPDYLSTRVHFLQKNPGISLVQGAVQVVGDPFVPDKRNLQKKIHLSECVVGATIFGRRSIFRLVGGFNASISYSEDSDFWERATRLANTAHLSHIGYIYYRDTPQSICSSASVHPLMMSDSKETQSVTF